MEVSVRKVNQVGLHTTEDILEDGIITNQPNIIPGMRTHIITEEICPWRLIQAGISGRNFVRGKERYVLTMMVM
jgi:hypothetical protein